MHADGSINLDVIEKQAASLVENGVSGAFVCGSTGESLSLTVAERMAIAERWKAVTGDALDVVVHAGHTCVADSKAMAAHAQKIGVRAIAAMAPCFFKPATVEDLVAVCAEIAGAAPELPFYFYHLPSMTGVNFPVVEVLKAGSGRIPTLEGVKFTYENLMDFRQCVDLERGRFNILFGRDEILLAGLVMGARGAVGTTYSFAAPLFLRVIEDYQSGDLTAAQREQSRATEMVAVLLRFGGLAAGKAMMKMVGIDCGPVRLPLRSLSDEQCRALRAELERIGFFDYCSRC
jgi:N-acetylneuraminate lyase